MLMTHYTACTATSKQSGQRCKRRPAKGRTVCSMHGGKSRVGPASPQWKGGIHSEYLPKRLLDDYRASLDNPDKLVLDENIALIDARLSDLLRRVDSGESGQLWRDLREARQAYAKAKRSKDPTAMAEAITTMCDLIDRGHLDSAAWAEIADFIERRRKLVESERKRLVEAQQVIHVAQAAALMALMVDAVQRQVRDEDALGAIVEESARLTGVPVPVEPPPAIPAHAPSRRAG